jgi:hypothetical protein
MFEHRAVAPLRVFLVLLFGIVLVFQTLSIPGHFAYVAEISPQTAPMRWPLTILAAFWLLCVEVVIVCTWRLLTLVEKDLIFTVGALRWVDAIVWSIVAAWVELVGVFAVVVLNADDPGFPMLLLGITIGVTVIGLLMVVMRALLRQATTLRTDMEAVI